MHSVTRKASGNINPCRFVKIVTTVDDTVAEASADTDVILGVSGTDTRRIPYTGLDDGLHAVAGEPCAVWVPSSEGVLLDIGGTVAAGDYLTATTGGKGITTTTDKKKVGAIALESGANGDRIRVRVYMGERSV